MSDLINNKNILINNQTDIKKIKFGEYELIVEELYTYQYDYGNGKVVLRFEIPDPDGAISYDQIIKPIRENRSTINYYINDVLKIVYEGFIKDFNCVYNNNKYSIEITEQSKEERDLDIVKNALLDIANIQETLLNNKVPNENNPISFMARTFSTLDIDNNFDNNTYISEFYAMMIKDKITTIDKIPIKYVDKVKEILLLLDRNLTKK